MSFQERFDIVSKNFQKGLNLAINFKYQMTDLFKKHQKSNC